jgi:DNA-binding transcriptional LysR family regulator
MLDISTRVLRAMIALDDLRHFSLAAERCHVTQSALSQMIGKLERDVNLRLVDRDRRRVLLTSDGERFVAMARRVMLELEEVSADLRDRANLQKGRVVITAQPSLAAHWLPPIIAAFQAKHPGVQIGLFDSIPEKALEQVRQRQADFALTARGPGMAGLQHRLLFHDRFVLVAPRSHPLARRKSIAMKDLAGHRFIRLIRSGSISQHLEQALRGVDVVDSGLEVEQVATLAGLLANELGISIVPIASLPYFDPDKVTAVRLSDSELARPIYLVWPAAAQLGPAAQSFVEMLKTPPSFKGFG